MNETIGLGMPEKLTNWAKEPSILSLKADLDAAKPFHDTWVLKIKHWNSLRNVDGKNKPAEKVGRSSVQPKLIRRNNEWRYSALSDPFLASDKLIKAEPETFEDVQAARQNQLVLNHQFRTKIPKVKFINEYVRTAVDEGTVIVRTGWERKTKMVKENVPVFEYSTVDPAIDAEYLATLEQAVAMKTQNPNGYRDFPAEIQAAADYTLENGIPVKARIVGKQLVDKEKILSNKPTVQIIDPENIYIDPSCNGDIDKAGFVVFSFETSKAELLKDGRYKNLKYVNWSGNVVLNQPDHATKTPLDFNYQDDLRKRVVAYEYWGYLDINDDENPVAIVATWIGDTLVRLEESPFPDELPPFTIAHYLPIRKSLMGEPDAELLEDNQKIVGAVMRGIIDLLGRSANSQQGMAKGWLDVTNRRRFEKGLDYEFNPGQGTPDTAVYTHKYPEIPNSALTVLNMMNYEAEALTGVKAFSGGLSGSAYGDVASAMKNMLDAASKRESDILHRLADGIKSVAKKIAAMNAVFLSEEETIRITNEEFTTVRREDLVGNFDVIIDIATPEVDEARSKDLGFMLQTMGPDMDPEMARMILAEIAELKRMPALAKMIREYKPQPDPFAEEMKKLELKKLQKEIEKLDSEINKNNALAGKAQSEKDLNDLDFVETETGTKHARDLEKQGEQARANQTLEITKGLLKPGKPGERQPDVEAAVGFNAITDMNANRRSGAGPF